MGRLSQTIDYLNADKVTDDDKKHKYTDIIIDDNLIKLRRKYQNEKKKKNECKKEAKSPKMDRLENG